MTREEAIAYYKKNAIRIKGIIAEENETLKDRFSQTLEATEMAIQALEQEPCSDVVRRQAVLKTLDDMDNVLDEDRTIENYKELLKECYEVLPTVNPQKTGRWIDDKCSICEKGIEDLIDSREWYKNKTPNYCPFCGVRVVESEG